MTNSKSTVCTRQSVGETASTVLVQNRLAAQKWSSIVSSCLYLSHQLWNISSSKSFFSDLFNKIFTKSRIFWQAAPSCQAIQCFPTIPGNMVQNLFCFLILQNHKLPINMAESKWNRWIYRLDDWDKKWLESWAHGGDTLRASTWDYNKVNPIPQTPRNSFSDI